jgi:N6-adenosine-specific RNA methylase IME4
MEAWGFKYKTCAFAWVKTKKDGMPLAGMGSYTKSNIELCLLGMRGHIKSVDKTVPQIVMHGRLGHSIKPPVVRDRIVQLFGNVSRIELFARQKIDGWDAIGYGIDGISIQDKIKQISNPDYVFSHIETNERITGVKSSPQSTFLFA